MGNSVSPTLSPRERQIMDIVYRLGSATAVEIRSQITNPPTLSAVRALIRILEIKGHLRHEQDGPRYRFLPQIAPAKARTKALRQLVQTFFDGSATEAMVVLIEASDRHL